MSKKKVNITKLKNGTKTITLEYNNKYIEYKNAKGELHRINGPAVESIDQKSKLKIGEWWFKNGKRHRTNGPAITDMYDGKEIEIWWFKDGKKHRTDGPAVEIYVTEKDQLKEWYINGELHRTDGPAVINIVDGVTTSEWYTYGELIKTEVNGKSTKEIEREKEEREEEEEWEEEEEKRRESGDRALRSRGRSTIFWDEDFANRLKKLKESDRALRNTIFIEEYLNKKKY